MKSYDVIVVGAGLAGLSAALELCDREKKVLLLEKNKFPGGRTASWNEEGMIVESGFHRHIGYYKELPKLLNKVGVKVNDIVMWEKQIDIHDVEKKEPAIFGISPFRAPIRFIRGALGNSHVLSLRDKISLIPFFLAGFKEYVIHPQKLDQYSVSSYAKKYRVTSKALSFILTPLSTGIFFLPPEEYSAKVFFGLFAPGIPRMFNIRIGAYLGGMTELLANPLLKGVKERGGEVQLDAQVKQILRTEEKVIGVELNNGEKIHAGHIILATSLIHAKQLLKDIVEDQPWFDPMLNMPTMSAVTIQFDLREPALPYDRTTFAPLTILASFAEQSRTTFKHVPGRLSVILSQHEKFIDQVDEDIFERVIQDAQNVGVNLKSIVKDYRVIRHKDKFYHLGPNHDWMRPTQETPLEGLILAGDYTRQPLYSTMEGAVISGQKAASVIN